jgi:hypothetical protein
MQQVKIFKSVDNELGSMEKEINGWLATSGVKLISVTGNIAPQASRGELTTAFSSADILVIVVYETA